MVSVMARTKPKLSRREQEILDIVYARGHATAADVRDAIEQLAQAVNRAKQAGLSVDLIIHPGFQSVTGVTIARQL